MEDRRLGLVVSPEENNKFIYHVDTGMRMMGQLATLYYKSELPNFSLVVTNDNLITAIGTTENGPIITARTNCIFTPSQIRDLQIDKLLLADMLEIFFEEWPGLRESEGWKRAFQQSGQERR